MAHTTKHTRALALGILKMGKAVTPADLEKHVGHDTYSASIIWNLRQLGFEFETEREGRSVKTYTLTKEPANAKELRENAPKAKKAKPVKVKKAAPVAKAKDPGVKDEKVASPKKVSKVTPKKVKETPKEDLEKVLKAEPAPATFAVDADWDSTEGLDLRDLI